MVEDNILPVEFVGYLVLGAILLLGVILFGVKMARVPAKLTTKALAPAFMDIYLHF